MKKLFSMMALLALSLFLILFFRYRVYTVIEIDGIMVSSGAITENLYNDMYDGNDNKIGLSNVSEYENIYKRVNSYYIGEKEKKKVEISYPVFSKDNSKVLNITESSQLIDNNFKFYEGYNGFVLADGYVFDKNTNERTDDVDYILLNILDKIYINSKSISLQNNNLKESIIKANSIVYFAENKIKYYEFENGTFVYKSIDAISSNSKIKIDDVDIYYHDFLKKINLLDEKKQEKKTSEKQKITKTSVYSITTTKQEKEEFVKPVIEFLDVQTNVYSLSGTLKIKDDNLNITKNPTFTIYVDDKVYSRKSFSKENAKISIEGLLPDTKIRLVGTFEYRNSDGKIIEKKFYDEKLVTKDISVLNPVLLSLKTEEIFNNKVSFSSIKLNNDKNDEVLKGIKKITIEIDEREFNLSLNDCISLKKLQSVSYVTSSVFKSNSKYDYKVKIYDVDNNELIVKDSKGIVRTSKKEPIVNMTVQDKDPISVEVKYDVVNEDDVILEDFKYILYDRNSKIIKEDYLETNSGEINLDGLNINEIYILNIYASYDLDNGNGKNENNLLNSINITTSEIENDLYIELYEESITSNSITLSANLGKNNQELMSLLVSDLTFTLKDENGNDVLDEFENKIQKIYKDPFINDNKLETFSFNNLYSNTNYKISFSASIKQSGKESLKLNVKNSSEISNDLTEYKFTTMKKTPDINIRNEFVNNNSISYEINVYDPDSSLENNEITINLYEVDDIEKKYVETINVSTSKDSLTYERLKFNNLNNNKSYRFEFKSAKYSKKAICPTTRDKISDPCILKNLDISLENGITGNIELNKLTRKISSKNLFNIENSKLWSTNSSENPILEIESSKNTISLGQKTTGEGITVFSYYLPDYDSQNVFVSFDYKYKKNSLKDANLYLISGKSVSYLESDLVTKDKGNFEYSFSKEIKVENGYISFVVKNEVSGTSSIEIKNLYIGLEELTDSDDIKFKDTKSYKNISMVSISDPYKSIEKYYIKIYKDNKLYEYVDSNKKRKTASFEYDIIYENESDSNYSKDIKFNIDFEAKKNYKVSLIIKPYNDDTEYELSSYEFSTYNEIRSINSIDDLLYLQLNTNYVVNTDLDFKTVTNIKDYVYNETFNGVIDFQGHRIDIYSYNPNNLNELINYYFYNIGNSSELKNFDLHVYINGQKKISAFSFVQKNDGKINNFKVTLEESTNFQHYNFSLVTYEQGKSGTISNFVGYLKTNMYAYSAAAVITFKNYGTVKNGYIYGSDINAVDKYTSSTTRNIAGIVANNDRGGIVSNVYSLVKVNNSDDSLVANLVSNTSLDLGSSTKNSYSAVELGDNRDKMIDPNFTYASSVSNVYYWNKTFYNEKESKNHKSIKINSLLLNNSEFQNSILNNEDNEFIVDEFVNNGYYPHINLYEKLPRQENILLPDYSNSELDVTNIESYEEDDNIQKLKMKIYNPENIDVKISSVNINSLPCNIKTQENEDKYIILTLIPKINDSSISFRSSYYVEKIVYSVNDIQSTIDYDDFEKTFSFELYKDIKSAEDFRNINENLSENYRILNDIDFSSEKEVYYISDFSGKLDGKNHILKNVKTENYSLFDGITTGSISNLNIENYISKKGLIDTFSNIGAEVNNVHIKEAVITPKSGNVGSIVNDLENGNVINSSITNVKISSVNNILYDVGGLVGFSKRNGATIENCFARNINIDLSKALGVSSIGGIAGNLYAGNISNVYATGVIKTSFANVAGIIGNQNNTLISNVYSNVDIISTKDNIAGISATSVDLNAKVYNSLSLGDLSTSYNNYQEIDLGVARTISSSDKLATNNNYAFNEQLFNGKISSYTNGEILLSLEELIDEKIYTEYLNFGNNFDYSNLAIYDENNELIGVNLPKLKDKNGKIMKYQDDDYVYEDCYKYNSTCVNKNKIEDKNYEFEILNIVRTATADNIIENESESEYIEYYIKVSEDIDELQIDGLVTDTNSGVEIIKDENYSLQKKDFNTYIVKLKTVFSKAYDSYSIQGIQYIYKNANGKDVKKTAKLSYKLEISMTKIIDSVEDWNSIDDTYQNYTVSGTIDCSDNSCDNNKRRVNRIVGQNNQDNLSKIIGITSSSPIFDMVSGEISFLTFENIKIETDNQLENIGLIRVAYATVKNINFNDVIVNAPNSNNVGLIGYVDNSNLENITLTNVKINGKSYVGGLVGYVKNMYLDGYIRIGDALKDNYFEDVSSNKYVCNVEDFDESSYLTKKKMIENCDKIKNENKIYNSTIVGNGQNVGGLFGFSETYYENWNVNCSVFVNNISVYNKSSSAYTGGVLGSGQGRNIDVNDIYVNSNGNASSIVTGSSRDFINAAHLYNVKVNNSALSASRSAGGAIGNAGGIANNLYIKNSVIVGYNNVGGITGSDGNITNSGIMNSYVGTTISKNAYAGGISSNNTIGGRKFNFVYNTVIEANGTVGAVYGTSTSNVSDTYSNATLITSSGVIGGVVGKLGENAELNNNIVANTILNGTNSVVGALVGELENQNSFSLANNVVVIDSTLSNNSYNNVIGSDTTCSSCFSNTYVYNPNTNDEQKQEYYIKASYENISDKSFYNELGFQNNYWNLNALDNNNKQFPKFNESTTKYQSLVNLSLPSKDDVEQEVAMFSMLRRNNYNLLSLSPKTNVHNLPKYYIYSSGVDRFNIEFDSSDGLSAFTLGNNTYKIDKKVFTFSYDYEENINILLFDGINSKKIEVKASDLIRHVGVYSKYYYYLSDDKLKGNIKSTDGKFKHIYNNKVLKEDGKIYDILTNEYILNENKNFELLSSTPLYEFEYNLKQIKTFYTFSLMDNEEIDKQVFIKNNDIQMISSVLDNDKTTIIMDSYDGNSYLTVLGLDGVIYNLKEKIKMPDSIINKNIKYVTNNMFSQSGIILVEYKNGSIYGFNYRTGEILTLKKSETKETIVDYFKNKFLPVENKSINENISKIYQESSDEYEKIISNEEESKSKNYVTVYEPLKNKYVVYEANNVTDKLSINDSLEKNAMLDITDTKGLNAVAKKGFSGVKILLIILLLVISSYVIWLKIVNKNSRKIKSN